MLKRLYSLALWLLLPYIVAHLLWRSRKQPEYLEQVPERFGFYRTQSSRPIIWLHAVSVGETRAAQSLIARLHESYPHHQILLTHTTPTGRAASRLLYGDSVLRVYLPYDYPFAVRRFLCHFKPRFGILMETEIWYNLIDGCRNSSVPLLLLNARLSEKSSRNYARLAKLSRAALGGFYAIGAQTAEDAGRLTELGAHKVSVTGNLKFDLEAPAALLAQGRLLRLQMGETRKVLVAASTREGEERLLLEVLERLVVPELLLLIVPRHPQRFDEVAALLKLHGIAFVRRSELGQAALPSHMRAVLGDSMGEMSAYYAASDLAFIGGSLLPFGGQNLIEACAAGAPVLIGPHTYNFAEATRLAVGCGAALQVADSDALAAQVQRLLNNPAALDEMRDRCAGFVASNRGATDKSMQLINSLPGSHG